MKMTYHDQLQFKIGLENKLFLLQQETIPSSFPLCIVSQGGNKECKAMSHDLSLTRIHTSLDRALESLTGWVQQLLSGEEKLILLKQMYQWILDQHTMAQGGS